MALVNRPHRLTSELNRAHPLLTETPQQHKEIFVRQLSLILQTFYTPPFPPPKVHPVFFFFFLGWKNPRKLGSGVLATAIQGHASCVFNQNSITVPHHARKAHSPGYEV